METNQTLAHLSAEEIQKMKQAIKPILEQKKNDVKALIAKIAQKQNTQQ